MPNGFIPGLSTLFTPGSTITAPGTVTIGGLSGTGIIVETPTVQPPLPPKKPSLKPEDRYIQDSGEYYEDSDEYYGQTCVPKYVPNPGSFAISGAAGFAPPGSLEDNNIIYTWGDTNDTTSQSQSSNNQGNTLLLALLAFLLLR